MRTTARSLSLLLLTLVFVAAAGAQPAQHQTFVPLVVRPETCGMGSEEREIGQLMAGDPGQQRAELRCDPTLAQVARARAADMAARRYFSHINPDGKGPNLLVAEAGYPLPSFYLGNPANNYIESIAAGNATASATWAQWMGSSGHRPHLLGEIAFWREQIEYGVGYAADPASPYRHYWVVITALRGT